MTHEMIKPYSELLREAQLCRAKIFTRGTRAIYDSGALPAGMSLMVDDIIEVQAPLGITASQFPGRKQDWVIFDGPAKESSKVEVDTAQNSGATIADIKVDGRTYTLRAPAGTTSVPIDTTTITDNDDHVPSSKLTAAEIANISAKVGDFDVGSGEGEYPSIHEQLHGNIVEVETDITDEFVFTNGRKLAATGSNFGKESSDSNNVYKATTLGSYVNVEGYVGKKMRITLPSFKKSDGTQSTLGMVFFSAQTGSNAALYGITMPFGDVAPNTVEVTIQEGWRWLGTTYLIDTSVCGAFKCTIVETMQGEGLIDDINSLHSRIDKVLGGSVLKSDTFALTSGGYSELTNYPIALCGGNIVTFKGKFSGAFGKVTVGFGRGSSSNGQQIDIDETKVYLRRPNSEVVHEYSHGISIFADFIAINLVVGNNGNSAVVTISTNNECKSINLTNWDVTTYGVPFVSSEIAMSNCSLSATNTKFARPVWLLGASYFGGASNRVVGALKSIGYANYLHFTRSGMKSTNGLDNIRKMLNFGTPKYLFWGIFTNDSDSEESTFRVNMETLISLCHNKGITLVCLLAPDLVPDKGDATAHFRSMNSRRAWLVNKGVRVVNMKDAVQAKEYDSTDPLGTNQVFWYPGMMGADGVHPTQAGAMAMAMQVLVELPEIAQYGTSASVSISTDAEDEYNGG